MHLLRPAQGRAAKLNIARRSKLTGNEHVRYDPRACASISASHHTTALRSMETRQARRPGRTPRPRFLSTSNTLRAVKCVTMAKIPARFVCMCYLARTWYLGVLCQSRAVSAYPSQTFSYAHSPRIVYTTYVLVAARNPGAGIRGHSWTERTKRVSA